ncbi:methyltransferase type 11 [Diaporthe sp. PMI_573]|nr:methyltransferase type 11 [Diaporthaceae sp. PMI_573]
MASGNDRFNAEAAAWDSNPDVRRASDSALQALLAAHPLLSQANKDGGGSISSGGLEVLEIGCGTGLLSVPLAPYVRSILAIDAAGGMIDALKLKLRGGLDGGEGEAASRAIQPLCILLEDPEDSRMPPGGPDGKRQKFDLVISHLVLHHIPELRPLLATMYGCLKPGGQIALTDFEDFGPEARKFHPEAKMFGVERHGINASWLAGLMKEVGFKDVDVSVAWTMEKEVERYPGEWGQEKPQGVDLAKMDFPFLLCRGVRKA